MDMQKLSGLIWPGLVVMLTGAYAYWASHGELVSSRPPTLGKYDVPEPVPTPGVETLHARLWQDPLSSSFSHYKRERGSGDATSLPRSAGRPRVFSEAMDSPLLSERLRQVVAERKQEGGARKRSSADEDGEGLRFFRHLCDLLAPDRLSANRNTVRHEFFRHLVDQSGLDTLCVPVFVPGGPYAEDKENRTRIRYAVLTAMAESGYKLKYSRQMSYVEVPVWIRVLRGWQGRPMVVPVKLYRSEDADNQILVLWINESQLGLRPLLTTHRILTQLFGEVTKTERLKVRIVGPASSDTLQLISREMTNVYEAAERIRIMRAANRVTDQIEEIERIEGGNQQGREEFARRNKSIRGEMEAVATQLDGEAKDGDGSELGDFTRVAIRKVAERLVEHARQLELSGDGADSPCIAEMRDLASRIRRLLAIEQIGRRGEDLRWTCTELRRELCSAPFDIPSEAIEATEVIEATEAIECAIRELMLLKELADQARSIHVDASALQTSLDEGALFSKVEDNATRIADVESALEGMKDTMDELRRSVSGRELLGETTVDPRELQSRRLDATKNLLVDSPNGWEETEREHEFEEKLAAVSNWAEKLLSEDLLLGPYEDCLQQSKCLGEVVGDAKHGNSEICTLVNFLTSALDPATAGGASEYLDHWFISDYGDAGGKPDSLRGFSPLWAPAQAGRLQPCRIVAEEATARLQALRRHPAQTTAIMSPRATAEIETKKGNRFLPDFVKVYHVIGTDRQLAETLKQELKQRGHTPYRGPNFLERFLPDLAWDKKKEDEKGGAGKDNKPKSGKRIGNVILITEHDTQYGQEIVSLCLNKELQKETPPFRDSYQTATFLATRLAVKYTEEDPARSNVARTSQQDGTASAGREQAVQADAEDDSEEEANVFDPSQWMARGNAAPVLHVVGKERFETLDAESTESGTAGPAPLGKQLHSSPESSRGNWFVILTGMVGGLVLLVSAGVVYRDWWGRSVLMRPAGFLRGQAGEEGLQGRAENAEESEEVRYRLAAWRPMLIRVIGALLIAGGLLFLASCVAGYLGTRNGGVLGANATWLRNAVCAVVGIAAVLCVARLVDRHLEVLIVVSQECSEFGEWAWESLRLGHFVQPLLLAVALAQAGVVFVWGFWSWATLFSTLLVLSTVSREGAGEEEEEDRPASHAEQRSAKSDEVRALQRQLKKLKLRKEQLSKISTGAFLPWNQAPYSWIFGGSASLALVDLWIRWWTINV